jgi:ferredoxin
MHAVRNIRLCTKDCLCLYVCPTGATDTETGQIDAAKCLDGCRACVDACPSHAIFLVPDTFPPQQEKTDVVVKALLPLLKSKTEQERALRGMAEETGIPILRQLATALQMSNRLMAEDLLRESGYLLPQSENVQMLLKSLLDDLPADFPVDAVERLLALLSGNPELAAGDVSDTAAEGTEKYECDVCGFIQEGALPDDFICPVCGQTKTGFRKV